MKHSSDHGRGVSARAYYASLIFPYFLRKLKLISDETYHRPVISRLAWMAKGLTEEQFRKATEWIINEHILPSERIEVIARLHDHQSNGLEILLVSGMPTPSLNLLGEHYKVNGIVGTKLELKNGRYTGRIIPPVITGHDKDRYAREYFSKNRLEVDWESSYAYADSITDMGLLGMVGHPVAVYPDKNLYRLAASKNWELIGETRNP